jgi:uncharacterized membrane protein YdfJ with MMPL/SSD domain
MTLASFIPNDQDSRLAMINDSATLLAPTLGNTNIQPQPDDATILAMLKVFASGLHDISVDHPAADRLAKLLDEVLARHDHRLLERLNKNLVDVMTVKLDAIRHALSPQRITLKSIPDELHRDWVTPDGQYLTEVYPKGNPRDYKTLISFTNAVRKIAPDAAGSPISIQESGHTVTNAFIHAGCYAVLAIAFLSFLILRRIKDVILMLTPLILAGILTLATISIVGLPLNFANIIALPLLLSLGVSYAIYFVSYWRSNRAEPLQSSMARAVLFSAATVLVAFGSLALSLHPGTSGMGKLLTVALLYSLISTFFVLPALLGQPKSDKE